MGAYADLLNQSGNTPQPSNASSNDRVSSFVEQYRPVAERVAAQTGNDPAMYLAQWGLETGWGKSVIPGTNNLGNIKDFSGNGTTARDNMTGSVDRYRTYESDDHFADDYTGLLGRRYKDALNVGSDIDAFAGALKRGGYAEDPNYVDKLKSAFTMVGGKKGAFVPKLNERGEYGPQEDYSIALDRLARVPTSTTGVTSQALQPEVESDSDFLRGLSAYWPQTKQMGNDLKTIAGLTIRKNLGEGPVSDYLVESGLQGREEAGKEIEALGQKESDSFTTALSMGPGALIDWMQHGFGQATGNILESLGTMAVGAGIGAMSGAGVASVPNAVMGAGTGLLAKTLIKQGVRETAEKLMKEQGEAAATEYIKREARKVIGGNVGLSAGAAFHGIAEPGGRAIEEATKDGGDVNDVDLGNVALAAPVHAGLEFFGDKILAKGVLGEGAYRAAGKGAVPYAKTVAGNAAKVGVKEMPVEGLQTEAERYAAGLPLDNAEAAGEVTDAMAQAALFGVAGVPSGHRAYKAMSGEQAEPVTQPNSPLSNAANVAQGVAEQQTAQMQAAQAQAQSQNFNPANIDSFERELEDINRQISEVNSYVQKRGESSDTRTILGDLNQRKAYLEGQIASAGSNYTSQQRSSASQSSNPYSGALVAGIEKRDELTRKAQQLQGMLSRMNPSHPDYAEVSARLEQVVSMRDELADKISQTIKTKGPSAQSRIAEIRGLLDSGKYEEHIRDMVLRAQAGESATNMASQLADEEGTEYQPSDLLQQHDADQRELQSLIEQEKVNQRKAIKDTWLDQHIARTTQGPTDNFAGMVEYENFLKQELEDIAQRRAEAVVSSDAKKAEAADLAEKKLKDVANRIEASRQQETEAKRNALLDEVLANNPLNARRAFDRALRAAGFNDTNFTDAEKAKIERFDGLRNIEDGQEQGVTDSHDFGIKERKEAPKSKFQHITDMLNSGWTLQGKQLVSRDGRKYNLKNGELAVAKAKQVKPKSVTQGESVAATTQQVPEEAVQAQDAQVQQEPASAPQAEGVSNEGRQGQPILQAPNAEQTSVSNQGESVAQSAQATENVPGAAQGVNVTEPEDKRRWMYDANGNVVETEAIHDVEYPEIPGRVFFTRQQADGKFGVVDTESGAIVFSDSETEQLSIAGLRDFIQRVGADRVSAELAKQKKIEVPADLPSADTVTAPEQSEASTQEQNKPASVSADNKDESVSQDAESKLRSGEINVEQFMEATGLTDDDIGTYDSSSLRDRADKAAKDASPYHSAIAKISSAIYEASNDLDRGTTPQSRKAYDQNIAKYGQAQQTLSVIAKNYEHPFNNNLLSKLPPFLKQRFGKQWESIEYGDSAKRSYYSDSYDRWVELLIAKAREKNATVNSDSKQETTQLKKRIEEAEQRTAVNPTEAQKESGNYVKGKFPWKGMTVAIETPKNAERSGVDENGESWKVTAPVSYGYFLGTKGADKEHLDVYIGESPESEQVFIINQTKVDSEKFDEHKVLIGFNSAEEAKQAYFGSFTDGFAPRVFGSIAGPFSVDEFKSALPKLEKSKPYVEGNPQFSDRVSKPLDAISVKINMHDGKGAVEKKASEALSEIDKSMEFGRQLLNCLAA